MKNLVIFSLRSLAVALCLFAYFLTIGIIFFVPGGDMQSQIMHALILLTMSCAATCLAIVSFKKLRLRPR